MAPDERLLWQRARTGSAREQRQAREALVRRHARLVSYARRRVRWYGTAEDEEDLLAAGRQQLAKLLLTFDPGRGVEFNTFAVKSLAGAMLRYVRDSQKLRVSVRPEFTELTPEMISALADPRPNPEACCMARAEIEAAVGELARVSARWPARHREALLQVAAFGATETEAAAVAGCSQMHVSRLVRQAERALGCRLPRAGKAPGRPALAAARR